MSTYNTEVSTTKKAAKKAKARLEDLLVEELPLWAEGCVVAGLDEVGAGPIAGPVTAACVVLDPSKVDRMVGVDDSKALSAKRRAECASTIRESAKAWAIVDVSVEEIDSINILQAALQAMRRALASVLSDINVVHHLLVDAREVPQTDIPQTPLVKGDARSLSVAAASIIAKVHRDALMTEMSAQYPEYGFERHKGYGTAAHLAALRKYGATPIHRRSFSPVSMVMNQGRLF